MKSWKVYFLVYCFSWNKNF